jgi:hypothetical protein
MVTEYGDPFARFSSGTSSIRTKTNSPRLNAACWSGGTLLYVLKTSASISRFIRSAKADGGASTWADAIILESGVSHDAPEAASNRKRRLIAAHQLIVEQVFIAMNLQNWGHEVRHHPPEGPYRPQGHLQWTKALGAAAKRINTR